MYPEEYTKFYVRETPGSDGNLYEVYEARITIQSASETPGEYVLRVVESGLIYLAAERLADRLNLANRAALDD